MDFYILHGKFPPECIGRIGSVIELQQWIINATDSNIEEVITKIKNSIFLEAKNIYIFVDLLISIAAFRYDSIKILVSIITKLFEQEIEQSIKDKIKSKLAKYLFKTQFRCYQLTLFVRRLYDSKIINIPSKEYINDLDYRTNIFPEFNQSLHGKDITPKFIGENCYPMGSPMAAVKEDDIDALMEFASQPSFDVNTPVRSYSKIFFGFRFTHDINLILHGNLTLIDIAAMFGSVRCFKYLHVLSATKTPVTANMAIYGGSVEIIRILDSEGKEFKGGINYATCCIRNEILDWLLDTKFDENNQLEIAAAFHSAVIVGNYYALMKLYNKANDMESALQMAIYYNHCFMVEVLVSASDYICDVSKQSAHIYNAYQAGSLKMVRTLYQNGADVNMVKVGNKFIIELAMESKSIKLLKYIFEETDFHPEANMHLFHIAIRTKDLEVIKYFTTTKFFDVNEQTNEGRNALHVAVSTDTPEIVEYIISLGVDPNHEDSNRNTPYALSVIYRLKNSLAVLEAHDEIRKEIRADQIRLMASKMLTWEADEKFYQKLDKEIKKYGGEPAEILKGIELVWGNPKIATLDWLSRKGLKITPQDNFKYIISER